MNNKMYVIDFDTSCIAFSLYDVALFCNDTDYFNFDIYGYERTANRLAEFYVGYQKYYSLSQEELSAIYSLIAIYHFQLQATMIELYGLNENQIRFFDSQYKWLQQWEEQCGDSKRQE
jgi:Ser/Thr protein kinase RdoA (MazF antagonist)